MGEQHPLADGPTDWGAVFSTTGESEDGIPRAPKRAGSSNFDYWWKDCGHDVSVRSDALSQTSTKWTKDLRQWAREAQREALVGKLNRARLELDFLSLRLRETAVGKKLRKRIATAAMNGRYVYKNGARKYVSKKVADARKAKRAAAARDRRWKEYAKTHGVDLATPYQVSH